MKLEEYYDSNLDINLQDITQFEVKYDIHAIGTSGCALKMIIPHLDMNTKELFTSKIVS